MGMNETPGSERIHIGFFGRRNAGKSSLVNAVTGQELAVVSETKGTTTDPVLKSMELLPVGPVVVIDTPGYDDEGSLGSMRVKQTRKVLNKTDIAVLVADVREGLGEAEQELISLFREKNQPYLIVWNKADLLSQVPKEKEHEIYVSAKEKQGIYELKERIAAIVPKEEHPVRLAADIIKPMEVVILVVPIDKAAPKGRLILPQQQVIRDILEAGAVSVVVRDTELKETLEKMKGLVSLVITDSQAFEKVDRDTPGEIALTSFSILMGRYKGFLDPAVEGVKAIDRLQDHDTVLICEGCTHHRQCDDIGTFKLPNWLRTYTGKQLEFEFTSGTGFPEDLSRYALVLHCGGCMLNAREIQYRANCAKDQGVPITNYGAAIAYMKGILPRSLSVFPELLKKLTAENEITD